MNRLRTLVQKVVPSSPSAPNAPALALEFGQIQRHSRHNTPHALFMPMHYEPNYAYPLVVWLHGPRDDERQLQRVMPLVSLRNYVAVGPRATAQAAGSRGFDWQQNESDIERSEQAIFDCIDLVSDRFNIAPHRIFVAGYGTGGTMAFRIGLRHPTRFAGVLSVCGPFPEGHMPLARLHRARQLPLFIAHGRDGEAYSIDRSCEELRLFHTAGLRVTLRQYPCGDELTTHMLADMDRWMMEIVTGIQQPPEGDLPSQSNELN